MKNPFLLLTGAALTGLPISAAEVLDEAATVNRPNILVIVCEDISPYLGCYGDAVARTPHLDTFARQGVRYTNMYTCVGVSSPSRYSLITGRYASVDGANYMRSNYFDKEFASVPPAGVKCYTELLRAQGYYCTNNAKTDYQFPAPLAAWDEQGEQAHWKHATDGQPFLSVFNLNVTHESFIWKNTDKPLLVSSDSVVLPPYYPDNAIVRHDHAVLYSNIAKMDSLFQALLNELEQSNRARNTIVIFYSDNGGPLPRGKREILDSGTHVPFLIRFPDGRDAGTTNERLTMFVDIPATILSLTDTPIPDWMHGQAMNETTKPRQYVFGATDRFDEQVEKRASIRTDRYLYLYNYMPQQSIYRPVTFRLTMPMMKNMLNLYGANMLDNIQCRWFEAPTDTEELYDCATDPHQVHNLATNPHYTSLLKQMRKAFRKEWIEKYNRDWERFSEADFVKRMWPEGRKPVAEQPRVKIVGNEVRIENNLRLFSASYQIDGKGKGGKSNHWMLYTSPVTLQPGDDFTVRMERLGWESSEERMRF